MSVAMDADGTETDTEAVVFRLGENQYCIDISYVDEIVERGALTPLPNAQEHIEGVMDLRGETTTIFNPRSFFDITADTDGDDRILILDQEGANVGWIVDSVDRVIEFGSEAVETNLQDGAVDGVLREDDQFIILVDPTAVDDTNTG